MKSGLKVLVLAAFVALCAALPLSAQEHHMNMGADAVKITISLTDYSFAVEGQPPGQPLQLQAGQDYVLTFANKSGAKMAHEVLFGKDPTKYPEGFADSYTTALLGDVPVMLMTDVADKSFMVNAAGLNQFEVPADESMSVEFTLPDDKVGNWELGCFEFLNATDSEDHPGPTHYDVGMHLPIIVSAAMAMPDMSMTAEATMPAMAMPDVAVTPTPTMAMKM